MAKLPDPFAIRHCSIAFASLQRGLSIGRSRCLISGTIPAVHRGGVVLHLPAAVMAGPTAKAGEVMLHKFTLQALRKVNFYFQCERIFRGVDNPTRLDPLRLVDPLLALREAARDVAVFGRIINTRTTCRGLIAISALDPYDSGGRGSPIDDDVQVDLIEARDDIDGVTLRAGQTDGLTTSLDRVDFDYVFAQLRMYEAARYHLDQVGPDRPSNSPFDYNPRKRVWMRSLAIGQMGFLSMLLIRTREDQEAMADWLEGVLLDEMKPEDEKFIRRVVADAIVRQRSGAFDPPAPDGLAGDATEPSVSVDAAVDAPRVTVSKKDLRMWLGLTGRRELRNRLKQSPVGSVADAGKQVRLDLSLIDLELLSVVYDHTRMTDAYMHLTEARLERALPGAKERDRALVSKSG